MTFGGHFDVELLINAMRILYKMYNKFSFYSIVVQTVAPEGSSATEGLKDMYIKIEIVTRLNDGQSMLGARAQASWVAAWRRRACGAWRACRTPRPRPCCW